MNYEWTSKADDILFEIENKIQQCIGLSYQDYTTKFELCWDASTRGV